MSLLLTLILVVPTLVPAGLAALPAEDLAPVGADVTDGAGNTPSGTPIPPELVDAYRLAAIHPDVQSVLQHYADRQGWIIPEPVVRDVGADALPTALDAFAATFGPEHAGAVDALHGDLDTLPDDLAASLAKLLYALVDAQALQAAALAPLTARQVRGLHEGTLTESQLVEVSHRANVPLTLQAASTLDAAVAEAAPVLQKWGLILQLENLNGRAFTADAVLSTLPGLPAHGPIEALAWAEALLAQPGATTRDLTAEALAATPDADLALHVALLYETMGVPLAESDVLTLAAMRGADPDLAKAVSVQVTAGLHALAALQRTSDPDAQALAALAPDLARVAAQDGASPADLAILAEAVALAEALEGPGGLDAIMLLVQAAEAVRELSRDGFDPVAPLSTTQGHGHPVTVGDVTFTPRSHPNGTASLTISVAGELHRTIWVPGGPVKAYWDSHTCVLVGYHDEDGDGVEAAGERLAATEPLCDLGNDVLFMDPFGYVIVSGEGESVIDDRYGAERRHTFGSKGARDLAWGLYNFTLYGGGGGVVVQGPDQDPADLGYQIFGGCWSFGIVIIEWDPGAGDRCQGFWRGLTNTFSLCFLGADFQEEYLTGDASCAYGSVLPDHAWEVYDGEEVTVNPDHYQVLTLDLGGSDTYHNNAGGTLNSTYYERMVEYEEEDDREYVSYRTRDPTTERYVRERQRIPLAMAIDLGGDDTYDTHRAFTIGSADVGVGFLYDDLGRDTYDGPDLSIASAYTPAYEFHYGEPNPENRYQHRIPLLFHGGAVAAVVDLQGDDAYTAGHHAIASANNTATSLLYDHGGNDTYTSGHESQAHANASAPVRVSPSPARDDCEESQFGANPTRDHWLIHLQPVWPPRFTCEPYVLPQMGLALMVEVDGDDTYEVIGGEGLVRGAHDDAQGRAKGDAAALLLDLGGDDTGLMTNGEASVENLLGLRFATRAANDKCMEPEPGPEGGSDLPCEKGRTARRGYGGLGFALEVDAPLDRGGIVTPGGDHPVRTPGARASIGDDPFFKLNFYMDFPGLLALGSERDTTWTEDFVLALDLGGHDTYRNAPGAATVNIDQVTGYYDWTEGCYVTPVTGENFPACPKAGDLGRTNLVALHVDADGADAYNVTTRGAGYGLLGIGMLYDLASDPLSEDANDVYDLSTFSGGAGVTLGLGALVDAAGDDRYTVRDMEAARSLGFGERAGIGILIDNLGDDTYTAGKWSVGSVIASSHVEYGAFLDADGADTYEVSNLSQGRWLKYDLASADAQDNDRRSRVGPLPLNATDSAVESGDPYGDGGQYDTANGMLQQVYASYALFVDDGLDRDMYDIDGSVPDRHHENDARWQYGSPRLLEDNPGGSPSLAGFGHVATGHGYDNMDWYLNDQLLATLDPDGAATHPFGPDFHAVRAILLSPSVHFNSPGDGDDAFTNASGDIPVEVLARIADGNSIVLNAARLAKFLLYEEYERYTCGFTHDYGVDPYEDGGRLTGDESLGRASNPHGGSHDLEDKPPMYCGTIEPTLHRELPPGDVTPPHEALGGTTAQSALALHLPSIVSVLDLVTQPSSAGGVDVAGDADIDRDALVTLLVDAAVRAMRGDAPSTEDARRAIDGLAAGRATTENGTPLLPPARSASVQDDAWSTLNPDRVRGSEDIGNVTFHLDGRYVGSCDMSGPNNSEATCFSPFGDDVVWFADGEDGRECRDDSAGRWGCFEFDWDTLQREASAVLRFPDGAYDLKVHAYYSEDGFARLAGAEDPLVQQTEDRLTGRLSDSYRDYPGWNRKLVYVDNVPVIYEHPDLTTVSDFVPDDATEKGTVVFDGLVSEPVLYEVWVAFPDQDGAATTDFFQLFANRDEPFSTPDFTPLDDRYRCVNESGARAYGCPVVDAKTADENNLTLLRDWTPDDAVEGLYTFMFVMWDRTHLPTGAADRGVRTVQTFTFWGDFTPPTAALKPDVLPDARVSRHDVVLTGGQSGTLPLTFEEDPSFLAQSGSRLERVEVVPTVRDVRTGATSILERIVLDRDDNGLVRGDLPVEHGKAYTLTMFATDRAGNQQEVPTVVDFQVDLEAPIIPPVALPDTMQPTKPLEVTWSATIPDPAYGNDVVAVDVSYAIVAVDDDEIPADAWSPYPSRAVEDPTHVLVDEANRKLIVDLAALGVTDALSEEPHGIALRFVAIDAFGNREGYDVTLGMDRKLRDGPVAFDTKPPEIGDGGRLIAAAHDLATIEWKFNEAAPVVNFSYARLGLATDHSCTKPSTDRELDRWSDPVTLDGGETYTTRLPDLESGHAYEIGITAEDAVGNVMTTQRFRFCTLTFADITWLQPLEGALLRGKTTAAWTVSNVRTPTGESQSGDTFDYDLRFEVGDELVDVGNLTNIFESVAGSRQRTLTVDTTKLEDTAGARAVLLVTSDLGQSSVALRFDGPTFTIDNTAPVTTAAVTGATEGATTDVGTWYRGPVDVTLTAADATTDVATTWMSVDGGPVQRISDVRIATAGMHTLAFNSTDAAGNVEKVRTLKIGVDTEKPRVQVFLANDNDLVRTNRVPLEVGATDAPSGVAEVVVRSGSGDTLVERTFGPDRLTDGALILTWDLAAGDGERAVTVEIRDHAGNVATVAREVVVDKTPPVILSHDFEDVGFQDVTVALQTDEDATLTVFVKRATDRAYQTRLDSAEAQTLHRVVVDGLFPATAYELLVVAEDALGNEHSATLTVTTRLDETPPSAVHDVKVLDLQEGYLVLEWREATDDVAIGGYVVYRTPVDADAEPEPVGVSRGTRFIDSDLTPGVRYAYLVQAEDAAGNAGPLSQRVEATATTRPTLVDGHVTPQTGSAGDVFQWFITYRDLDGDRPAYVRVHVNGEPQTMHIAEGSGNDYREGVVYVYESTLEETRLSGGMNTYRFEASDGANVVRSLVTEVGPVVALGGDDDAGRTGVFGLFSSVREAPALAAIPMLLLFAAAAVVLRRRRDA